MKLNTNGASQAPATAPTRRGRLFLRRPTVRGLITVGFGLLFVVLIAVVAGSAAMIRKHRADVSEMETLSNGVATIQNARTEAANAALLIQRYIISGDETGVPDTLASTQAAVKGLHEAEAQQIAEGDVEQAAIIGNIAKNGDLLAAAVNQMIALRREGNVEQASTILEAIVPQFREFRRALGEATSRELDQVAAVRSRANQSGEMAFWLLIISGLTGGLMALLGAALIARSILRPLQALERTARCVGAGDLQARTRPSGPRELYHLGETLNTMAGQLQERENELRLSYQELKQRNRQLLEARALATTDALTGLYNHRAFHENIRREFKTLERNGGKIGVIMLDIDGFKEINDSLGHLQGDEILRQCAQIFCEVVDSSCLYRYGGDEFAVILPGADDRETMETAERLRRALVEASGGGPKSVTVSLGVANYPGTASSAEELIYEADAAMYAAKSAGKNTVMRWDAAARLDGHGQMHYGGHRDMRVVELVRALHGALAAKDPSTHAHSERCAEYAGLVAKEMGLPLQQQAAVRVGALLHDIGKLAVPDEILVKPGPLSKAQWAVVRQHPLAGYYLVSQLPSLADALPAILHHHEHYDGSGYPEGLSGEDIPLVARIILVADAYDAMTTDRPYRTAMSSEAAIEELRRYAGKQFDPQVIEALLRAVCAHPQDGHASTAAAAVHPRAANGN